ncbi:MAG: ribonuclease III [Bacteroidota bacterium]
MYENITLPLFITNCIDRKMLTYLIKPIQRFFSPEKDLFKSLRQILGFYPDNITIYKLAFRHKSDRQMNLQEGEENKEANDNERLEYLGDAVLSASVAYFLFRKFPFKNEGFLTEMRSKIVSRTNLNKLALILGLDKFINSNIRTGGKSIYGNAFEAFVGAIYIDKGYKYAEEFILNRVIKYHIDIDELEEMEVNYKGKLIDWAQKEKREFEFEVIREAGKGYNKKYCVQVLIDNKYLGKGEGATKKMAEQRAAEETCKMLEINGS